MAERTYDQLDAGEQRQFLARDLYNWRTGGETRTPGQVRLFNDRVVSLGRRLNEPCSILAPIDVMADLERDVVAIADSLDEGSCYDEDEYRDAGYYDRFGSPS